MCVESLPALLLDDVGHSSLQYALGSLAEGCAMLLVHLQSMSSRLHSVQLDALILHEGVEGADGVRPATDASHDGIGELPGLVQHLHPHLLAHDALEITDDDGEGMRPDGRADEVVRVPHVGHPIPHGLVDGVLEGALPLLDGHDLGAEGVHAENVELLPLAVDGAHVHGAVQPKHGADGGGGDAVLAGAGLGDDAGLADALGQQGLADGVVDLVGAGVGQIFALEPDGGAAGVLGEALGLVQRRRSSDEVAAVPVDLGDEVRIVLDLLVLVLDLHEGLGQSLGDELAAELSEALLGVPGADLLGISLGNLAEGGGLELGRVLLRTAGAEVLHDLFDGGGALLGGGIFSQGIDRLEDFRTDDDAVGDVGDALDHVGIGDAEADGEGQVGLGPDAADEVLEVGGQGRPGPGDAGDGDAVDERRGRFGQVLDAIVRRGRGDEGDVGKAVLAAGGGQLGPLLGGQIDDDEAVGSLLLGLRAQIFQAELEEGVVVPHEDDGDGQAHVAGLLHHGEAGGYLRRSSLDGDLVGLLDGGAVGLRVGVRDAQLDDRGPSLLQSHEEGRCVFGTGIPGGDEGDEGGPPGLLGGGEGLLDPTAHPPPHGCYVWTHDAC
mmetsp:Transcript_12442/g.29425  ORF Transcript_12442/g.29425 Transcript_12442/m.29425 type:complete len:608 (-) Transcript_12442:233-2056(-)